MKIGLIGLGNMATAMIGGILKRELVQASDIIGSAKTKETMERVKVQYGIETGSNKKVASVSDILIIAVKPIFFREVAEEIKDDIKADSLVVSIAAGVTLQDMEAVFGRTDLKYIRCMPNTPALVLAGCTGVCADGRVTEEDWKKVLRILEAFGTASVVPERLMDVVVGVSGSSPAYVFLFIEAMADAAVAGGMPRKQAYEFAAQSVMGSAKLMLETGRHPGELKDMVCSPAGTTIEAVKVLEEKGFRGTVFDAVEACIRKAEQMHEKKGQK